MKKDSIFIKTVYIFLLISGSAYGIGEKTLVLGGESGWKPAEFRQGVTEVTFVRPFPVLTLSSAGVSGAGYSAAVGILGKNTSLSEPALDLSVSFDERDARFFSDSAGNYNVTSSRDIEAVDRRFARAGTGAALFGGTQKIIPTGTRAAEGPLVIEPANQGAMFAAGNRISDFTFEFWLYPLNLENGEEILSWVSTKTVNGKYTVQEITCTAMKNRLQWSFSNFFTPVSGGNIKINLSGDTPVIPKKWSHHLLRFDAETGMIEYIVDGHSETIVYATLSGREGGEVYTPAAGNSGVFVLGEFFMGLIDEFKIHKVFAGRSSIQKYAPPGGRMETKPVDLGVLNSSVVRVEVSGGRTSVKGKKIDNEFRDNGRFHFSDDSEMQFFIRAGDHPYRINEKKWVSFVPGAETGDIRGRYVQLAVDFYPSSDGETSPYLDEVRLVFLPDEPPLPPGNLTVVAADGAVLLKWKQSSDRKADGYLVYYSSVRDELFGEDASCGPSPVDVGKRGSFIVEGLANGTLYYFRLAAYNLTEEDSSYNIGEFSREVTARPLHGLKNDDISLLGQ